MDLISALTGGAITLIASVIAIVTNKRVKTTLVNRLVNTLKGRKILTLEDLKNHDIFAKLTRLAVSDISSQLVAKPIKNKAKLKLFEAYVTIVCQVYLNSIKRIIGWDFDNVTENELEILLIEEGVKRSNEEHALFREHLLTLNNDVSQVDNILSKLQDWKITELSIVENNVIMIVNSNRFNAVEFRLDTIFSVYSVGVDFLLKSGAESFNRLNGDLDNFLNDK